MFTNLSLSHSQMDTQILFTRRLSLLLLVMHATQIQPSISSDNTTDRLALLAFKASISVDPSGVLSSWNDTAPVCSWPGITCGVQHPDCVTAIDLHSMNLAGTISPSITNLTFLHKLYLAGNALRGHIPGDIGRLSRLQFLNISYNSLDGEIPTSLAHCSKLQQLLLGANQLTGRIPAGLSNCTELTIISLRASKLVGGVPLELTTLPKLDRLILGTNNLGGRIPPEVGNLTTLSILDIAQNNLVGGVPDAIGRITGLGSLQISFNLLTGAIPPSIYNLSSIRYLHVATNQLVGTLPSDIGRAFPKLQFLFMFENIFHGPIPTSLSNASDLVQIELAANRFSGQVPPDLGMLPNLVEVLLADNLIEDGEAYGWRFLNSVTNCSNLQIIDMYGNSLQGRFPDSVANLSTTLWKLSLNYNKISGSIPEGIGNLVGLTALYLGENLITGPIPATIGNLQNLHVMNFSDNGLSGEIPHSIGNLSLLNLIALSACKLVGNIPISIGNLQDIEVLDLSYNRLTGTIPKEVAGLSSLSAGMDLSNNLLYGSLPVEVGKLKNIEMLSLSNNKLSGEIPSSLGGCQILVFLYMDGNNFEGGIPQSLSNLKGLEDLDLSRNNISGGIPEFLQRLQYLKYLNLSFNNLQGVVPTGGIFRNITLISLQGNDGLCGGNKGLSLQACSIQHSRSEHRFPTITKIIVCSCAVLSVILLLALLYARHRLQKRQQSSVAKSTSANYREYPKISYSELRKATDDFASSNLIGTGSFGCVYKGVMDDGNEVIAVKVLNLRQKGASKSFMAECESMRRVRHRNLVKILTACSSVDSKGDDFKALVYEFMPNGSLEEWLHGRGERRLSFTQRRNIAVDVASALVYLHSHGRTPIVHCDLKPSNVLLDKDMRAHVGDFGLARIMSMTATKTSGNSSSSTSLKGTIGYVAPEYGMGTRVSVYGDVYSYGILLLEMFIGKRPTDEMFKNGLNLHKYVETCFPDNIMEIIEPQLQFELKNDEANDDSVPQNHEGCGAQMKESIVSLIGLGLSCSKELPRDRMELEDALKEMDVVKKQHIYRG